MPITRLGLYGGPGIPYASFANKEIPNLGVPVGGPLQAVPVASRNRLTPVASANNADPVESLNKADV